MFREKLRHITRDYLLESKQISVRAYNVCGNAELYTLDDILTFYEEGNSFKNIRNSGNGTTIELEEICTNVISQIKDYSAPQLFKPEIIPDEIIEISKTFNSLNEERRFYLEAIFQKRKEDLLDVRSKNALSTLNSNLFYQFYILDYTNSFLTLSNVGGKTIQLLNSFKSIIIEDIKNISLFSDQDFFIESNVLKYGQFCSDSFIYDYFQRHEYLPMLWILGKQLEEDEDRDIDIVKSTFKFFEPQNVLTLDEIAEKYSIVRERARQIRIISFEKIFNQNSILFKYFNDWQYYIKKFGEIKIIAQNDSEIRKIITEERCNLSSILIIQILSVLFKHTKTLVGGFDINRRLHDEWKSALLINNDLYNTFDFIQFKDEIKSLKNSSRCHDEVIDINIYIQNSLCWKEYSIEKIDSIISVAKEILLHEFQLYSDINGIIHISANNAKPPSVVIYEILKDYGNPIHIDELFAKFKQLLPDHKYTDPNQIRPILQHHQDITFRNRSSTYVLKDWKHIKSGTIRDAIVEFLMSKDKPQSDTDITDYVLQFFPESNLSSIRTSMSNDSKQRFISFKNSLFGLRNRTYSKEFVEGENPDFIRKSFNQRIYDLERFLIKNEHFPFSKSEDEKEEALYRWWTWTTNGKKELEHNQNLEIERIKNQYADLIVDKRSVIWFDNFNKARCFVLENSRLPYHKGDKNEQHIYNWLAKTKSDYFNDSLTEIQRDKYVEFCKLIRYASR